MEGFHHTCTFLIAVAIVFGYISRSEADCPAPTDDANGGHTGATYAQGDTITYTCNANYGLAATTAVIATCHTDDTWTLTAPVCVKDCGTPTDASNGGHTGTDYTETQMITYTCNTNYVLGSGSTTATCGNTGSWSSSAPDCKRDCTADPSAPSNGAVTSSTHLEGDTVTYSCSGTYGLSGSATATCQSDGTWDNTATTCLKDCTADPSAPSNGAVTSSAHLEGDTVTYSCSATYGLSGSATATCQSDGTWDNTATMCVEDCGQPPALTNGQFTAASTIATSTGTYTCNQGYTLDGTASRTCQTDRTWDGTAPTCQAAESSANGVYSRFTAVLLSTCLIIFFQTAMTWN